MNGDDADATATSPAANAGDGFDPIAFLETAVQYPSHEDVEPMRGFLRETLESRGVEARVDEAGNVVATRGPADAETHVVLNTHIDTVSPHVPFERDATGPVAGDADAGADADSDFGSADGAADDVIRGRGSCDAKGPLAALLAAFFAVEPTDGRVTLAITPDEEVLSIGAYELVTGENSPTRDADAVIVGEPTDLDVCTAAKGRFQGTIHLEGANAHAAEPETGSNAVAALESVLSAIRTFDERDDAPPAHLQLGAATLTPTVVEGGAATNQVPADCALTVDRRSVPPETADEFHAALTDRLARAVPDDVGVDFRFTDRPTPFLEAWDTDPDAEIVEILSSASGGAVRPFTAATEASYFAADAPTVVFGPGVLADETGAVAHAPREYVRVEQVRKAASALEETLRTLVE
ncbi:M20 family metallopeptidase [Natronolimnohabitans innermongolicus]|uniref:Succinyl-diaminopimelate desuccinylase n=1 Tax=Natronolimnohabitans innermongolicus JCM 12255 TaxID=1227499 RepID=L9XCB5_9EURY|nr:M20 family metallopeptidase [Natronolimnohabitans innermongolicus]ELY59056.1 succinyl-diaminopimelate desuccinylase [Natronolimnohabitans innermongolicus JCM 12255]